MRGELRRRWLPTLVVAAIVALASGTVLTLAAGARRTANAPDAFSASLGGNPDATVTQQDGPPRTAEVAGVQGVRSVEAMSFLFATVVDPHPRPGVDSIAFTGSRTTTSRLIAGRQADPSKANELVADRKFATTYGVRVGDHVRMATWSRDQVARSQGFSATPQGPSVDGVVVGISESPESLEDAYRTVVFSPALVDQDIGLGETLMNVRLEPGSSVAQFRAELDKLPNGQALQVDAGSIVGPDVRRAVETQARATWIVALVAVLAALIAVGQLLIRHGRLSRVERQPLAALGMTRAQLTLEAVARAMVPAIIGIAAGVVLAFLASGLFPAGFVRPIDPHRGLHLDVGVLVLGAAVLAVALLCWVTVAFLLVPPSRTPRPPSTVTEAIARRLPSSAAATGSQFALSSNDRARASAVGSFVVLGVIVGGLIGATAFAASLDRLVTDRGRFGSNYDFGVGELGGLTTDQLRAALADDTDISGLMLLSGAQARAGDATVGIIGVETVRGGLAPKILTGHAPSGPDELALGRVTARQLHLHVGDEVALAGDSGRAGYQVVGLAVVPTLGGIDGVGNGAVMTADGLRRLAAEPSGVFGAVVLRSDAPSQAAARIAARLDDTPNVESTPASIVNLLRVRRIPGVLAVLVGILAVITLVHALLVSIHGHRRDLAVLRALGANGPWLRRAVHAQSTTLTILPALIGVPLGLLLASVVFRGFVNHVGAVPDPVVPVVLVVLIVAALVVVANLATVVPARRARLAATGRLLQAE
jgi:hypothetical protein